MSECSLSYADGVTITATPEPPEPPRRQRVAALAPDDRRAALIEATIPLLRTFGVQLTTRQIAEAAGVAEGTIFGVFTDKASLIKAALIKCFDPGPAVDAISGIKTVTDLRERLVMIVDMLSHGVQMQAPLMAAIRTTSGLIDDPEILTAMMTTRDAIVNAVADAVLPDRYKLRRSPLAVAQTLVFLIFASGANFAAMEATDPGELVSILLDGLLVRTPATSLPRER